MFQVRYKTLHMAPVEKFPFIIFYHVEEAKKLMAVARWFSITPIISLILPNLGKDFYKFAVEFAVGLPGVSSVSTKGGRTSLPLKWLQK